MPHSRGLAIRDILTVLLLIALILAFVLPVLARARQHAKQLEDQQHLLDIHQGLIDSSFSDPQGRYLSPDLLHERSLMNVTDAQPDPGLRNTTANLYSAMVAANYVDTATLVSPLEPNRNVEEYDDYDFDAFDPIAAEPSFWDPGLQADLATLSHASYAHTPIYGRRAATYWKATGSGWVIPLGNRGVEYGNDRDLDVYESSNTLRALGPKDVWHGHVCLDDHSIEVLDSFYPMGVQYRFRCTSRPDNIFRMDLPDDSAPEFEAVDIFLTFTSRITRDGDGDLYLDVQFD